MKTTTQTIAAALLALSMAANAFADGPRGHYQQNPYRGHQERPDPPVPACRLDDRRRSGRLARGFGGEVDGGRRRVDRAAEAALEARIQALLAAPRGAAH